MRTLCLLLLCCITLFHASGQPGSLDSAFGKNGIQTTVFIDTANTLDENGQVVLTNANGDIFVVAQYDYVKIAKYSPDGRLDSSYGKAGYSNLGTSFFATSATFQGDKIIVAGYYPYDYVLARYTANGSLDSTFGVNGMVTTGLADYGGYAFATTLQGDKILVAGFTLVGGGKGGENSLFALVRYTTNGTLDTSFGSNGIVTADLGGGGSAKAITLQGDKILVAGSGILARFTANGVLDSSFGVNGKVTTGLDYNAGSAESMTLQSDKIIVAGSSLVRFTADGKPDSSFGVNGQAITGFGVNSIALQGDKIIVAGSSLARYTANGTLDSSFGVNGQATIDFGANSIALQGNKIIATGGTFNPGAKNYDFALARYTADGTLDASFGVNGTLTGHFFRSQLSFTSTVLQGDKTIAAGYTAGYLNTNNHTDFALARYAANGRLDSSFGVNGIVTTDFNSLDDQANAIALQGDKIIVAGSSSYFDDSGYNVSELALARYTADGVLDHSFGVNGKVTADFGARAIVLQGDKIVVAGSGIARYTADGVLDSSFGVNGRATIDFGANAIMLQGEKIIAAGNSDGDFALTRYTADGKPDSSFGANGKVTTSFNSPYDVANAIVLQGDKIVAAGSTGDPYSRARAFALARYTADGTLDSSFGVNGKVTTHFNSFNSQANAIAIQGDKIIVAGFTGGIYNGDFALARYTADGALDSSFGVNGQVTTSSDFPAYIQGIALQQNRLYAVGGLNDYSIGNYGVVAAYQLEATGPAISISDVTVCESQKQAVLTVHLSAPSNQVIRMYYQTHYITAYTPQDYIGGGAILYIPAGTTAATIKIPIVNDSICEPTEQFEVLLRNACHATFKDSVAIITIKDDDCSSITAQASSSSQQAAQISTSLSITASPNPSTDAFTIQLHSNDLKQPVSIRLYDVSGRLLERREHVSIGQSLRLGDQYKAGTYMIEAVQGDRSVQTKVIKTGK